MCLVENCQSKPVAKGICNAHRQRFAKYGNFEKIRKRNVCNIDNCNSFVKGHGLCSMHIQRQQRWGNPFGYEVECARCGCLFLVIRIRKYCLGCKIIVQRAGKADNQQARHRSMCRPDYKRLEIFERDGWICYLCNELVNPFATSRLLSASIDHIIPVSKGGKNIKSNVNLAHLLCNIKKNDKEL